MSDLTEPRKAQNPTRAEVLRARLSDYQAFIDTDAVFGHRDEMRRNEMPSNSSNSIRRLAYDILDTYMILYEDITIYGLSVTTALSIPNLTLESDKATLSIGLDAAEAAYTDLPACPEGWSARFMPYFENVRKTLTGFTQFQGQGDVSPFETYLRPVR